MFLVIKYLPTTYWPYVTELHGDRFGLHQHFVLVLLSPLHVLQEHNIISMAKIFTLLLPLFKIICLKLVATLHLCSTESSARTNLSGFPYLFIFLLCWHLPNNSNNFPSPSTIYLAAFILFYDLFQCRDIFHRERTNLGYHKTKQSGFLRS